MSTFEYTAIDLTNSIHRGLVRAWTKRQAARQVKDNGLAVVTIARVHRAPFRLPGVPYLSRMDRIVFTRNLMTMMRAGMNLTEALASTREQTGNRALAACIADAESRVLAGQTLSSALSRYPQFFSPVFIAMIQIGERGGKLVDTLTLLTKQQEHDFRLIRRIRNALVYPTLILATMIGIVTLMMVFVIPKIAEIYAESTVALPLATRILIGVSEFVARFGAYGVAILILLLLVARRELSRSVRFRRLVHRLTLRLPLFGDMLKRVNLAIASRTIGMLAHAGVSIDEGLVLAGQVTNNLLYQEAIQRSVPFVKRGVRLSDVFRGQPQLFLSLFQKMVATGEQSGNLDEMFEHIAAYYDEDVEHWTANVSSLIEPILLLATGVLVGGIALAVLFPLWNFANIL